MTPSLSDFLVVPQRPGGLRPSRQTLANGVVVLSKESPKTPAVTIQITVKAGSIGDPDDHLGTACLVGRVLDRGTATRAAAEIAEGLEDRGASLAITVARHFTSLSCTCLATDVDQILALLADIVMTPSFPDAELAIQRGELVTQIKQDADNPAVRAMEGLMALVYGPTHLYGRPAKGTAESIERLPREVLQAFHQARFSPHDVIVAIVGAIAPSRAADAAAAAFGAWTHPAAPVVSVPPVPHSVTRRQVVLPMMNKSQADIAYGFTTISRSDPDYYAFWLLNTAVGQYAMGGRLGENIRERQGMAYYAMSVFDANVAPGPFVVRAGVSAANVERTIRAIDDELHQLLFAGLSQQELDDSRQYLIGSLPRTLETNAGIAQFLVACEFFGLGVDYDERLLDLLGAVTLTQVRDLARRHLSLIHI